MGSSWNLIPAAVRSSTMLNKVLTSKLGVFVRNLARVHAKAISVVLTPLVGARIAAWFGYEIPVPLLGQFVTLAILGLAAYVPANKPKLPST
jgi:hypothetical protein